MDDEHSIRETNKICAVCSDRALGYNFSAVSCESCKAFFRRNALKKKDLRCPFTDNCKITPVTRRFCQKCRLDKCFSVGMRKEHIMSEEDKILKRQKIELNRVKKRTNTTSESKISGMKREDTEELSLNSGNSISITSAALNETSVPEIHAWNFNNEKYIDLETNEETVDNLKIKRDSKVNKFHETTIPISLGTRIITVSENEANEKTRQKPLGYINSESRASKVRPATKKTSSFHSRIDDCNENLCEKIVSKLESSVDNHNTELRFSLDEDSVSLERKKRNKIFNLANKISQNPDLMSKFSGNQVILSRILENQDILMRIMTDPQMIARLTTDPIVLQYFEDNFVELETRSDNNDRERGTNVINHEYSHTNTLYETEESQVENPILTNLITNRKCDETKIITEGSSAINSRKTTDDVTRDILQDVQSIPIAANSIGSILCEAITLEFSASSLGNNHNSRELNDSERAKLNELIVANKALHAPLDDDITNLIGDDECRFKESEIQSDPMLLDVINLTAIAIRRLIKMSKKINAFKNMCQEDQLALLKGGCTEMMILRSAINYDPDRHVWKIPHTQERMSNIKVDVLKEAKGNLYAEHAKFVTTFDPKWRDENIILILSAIALFTPDRPKVVHSDVIKLEQNSYYYLLRRYLESLYSGCEAKSTFLKLIQKISELHRLNQEVVGVYLNTNPSSVEPLLIEIFDLKH